jgi:hypothetical protein
MSISVALYGLILFYSLTREELEGRRPFAKFLSIKLIVMFTFYQSFVVRPHVLSYAAFADPFDTSAPCTGGKSNQRYDRLLHVLCFCDRFRFVATKYWTATNISDGLNALAICIEVCQPARAIFLKGDLIDILLEDGFLCQPNVVGLLA